MKILAFDTSTKFLSIACLKGNEVKASFHKDVGMNHSELLMPEIGKLIGDSSGGRLCALLKKTNPRIYKDQLAGAKKLLKQYALITNEDLEYIISRDALSATRLRDFLEALEGKANPNAINETQLNLAPKLECYGALTENQQEVING